MGRNPFQELLHFIVGSEALALKVFFYCPFPVFLDTQAHGGLGDDMEFPLGAVLIQGEHSAGPGSVFVYGTSFGFDKGAGLILIFFIFRTTTGNPEVSG